MSAESSHGPVSQRVLKALKRHARSKVLDMQGLREGRRRAEEMHLGFVKRVAESGAELPGHAAYMYAQNFTAELIEVLAEMPELRDFVETLSDAEEEYMPGWPPMSPISKSYFVSWTTYDLPVGARRETLGQIAVAISTEQGMHREVIKLMQALQDSRMGIYRALDQKGRLVRLRELCGEEIITAEVASGYTLKRPGELWYTRVLPPPMSIVPHHVMLTSPYVLLHPPLSAWTAYIERAAATLPRLPRAQALEEHFKWGPEPRYWAEFIFEGYVNHEEGAIFLAGLPDIPETRPHSGKFKGF